MTTRADFEREEWEVVQRSLSMVPAAVIRVAHGGMVPEILTVGSLFANAGRRFTTELSQSLINSPFDIDGSPRRRKGRRPYTPSEIEVYSAEVWYAVREATTLVEKRATPDEIGEFKSIILYVADSLARVGKEGDPLGITGPALAESEKALLHQIADALGMEWQGE